jgi:hypothetical protein
MTCYQRHLGPLFDTLGLAYEKPERARVDAAIRRVLGFGPDAHCPEIWAAIKALSPDEREQLPVRVTEHL